VSVFESEPTGTAGISPFAVVLRGYARDQVDHRIAQLVDELDQERQKTEEVTRALQRLQRDGSARQQLPPSFVNLGAEAGKVLEQAGSAAEKLLGEAAERAQQIVTSAETRADDVVDAAEERAAELEEATHAALKEAEAERDRLRDEAAGLVDQARARAEQEAKALVDKALDEARLAWKKSERSRLLLEAETDRLETLRQITAEQLKRMQAQIGLALVETAADDDDFDIEVDDEQLGIAGIADDAEPEPEPTEQAQVQPAASPR
jgi:cell division septum initiation protein DivIVA